MDGSDTQSGTHYSRIGTSGNGRIIIFQDDYGFDLRVYFIDRGVLLSGAIADEPRFTLEGSELKDLETGAIYLMDGE